jgi:hypothetical protein
VGFLILILLGSIVKLVVVEPISQIVAHFPGFSQFPDVLDYSLNFHLKKTNWTLKKNLQEFLRLTNNFLITPVGYWISDFLAKK